MKKILSLILAVMCFCCVSCTDNPKNAETDDNVEAANKATDNNHGSGVQADIDIAESDITVYPIKMIRADGKLYYDTGENSRMTPRCGTLDGNITSVCGSYNVPKKDGEANFGVEDYYNSGWQNASDSTKEIPTEDGWRIYKKVEIESRLVYELNSCMRVVRDGAEEIILSSEDVSFDSDGNALYTEKTIDEIRITIPVKYGTVYDWGITLLAKDVTESGMTLVVKQSGGNLVGELNTGSAYSLQVWNGKYWDNVSYSTNVENVGWDDVAYIIPKNGEREFPINWEWLYGRLPAGRYMISKEFMDFKVGTGHDEHIFYLEFEIPEQTNAKEDLCGYPTVENTCPYALLYDGVMYYYTGEYIFEDVEYSDKDILGSVTSTIPETRMPSLDRQANIDIEGSIFMKHELAGDGLLVLIDNKWEIFERRDNSTEPETIGAEGADSYTVGTADNWSVWECGAVFGVNDSVGINHWIVDQTHDGISTTSIVPDLDGEYYCSFGLRKNRSKSGDFVECKTFRVVSKDGKLVEVEEIEALTKQTVLEKGVPFSGKLDGSYYCETRRGADYDAHTITHSLTVGDGRIKLYSYVKSTCGGGCYEGDFKYSDTDGTLTADIVYTATSEGDVFTKDFKIEGKLLEYGGFVHFVLTDCEPEAFHLTTEDPFPMTFRVS